jgi:hypothetical protein
VLHIYLIHLFAMVGAFATGYSPGAMVFDTWVGFSKELTGYGFSLGGVYLVWLILLISLYPLCKWFEHYKTEHRERWWLSYL